MPKASFPENEAKRLAALRECCVLDTEPELAFDDLTELASRLCETPIALVSLVDAERQWFKSAVGVDVSETHRDAAFCAHAIHDTEPFVVTNATTDPRTFDNPLVTDAPGIRFYAGIPLITSDGFALGTLCVIDLQTRSISDGQLQDLQRLARQVVAQLQLRRSNRQQRRHLESLTRSQRQLARQAEGLLQHSEKLKEANQEAETANHAKSAFLANMSHELRTPLTSILGAVELLTDEDPVHDPSIAPLPIIRQSAQHLLALINDILDLSKIESGHLLVEYTSVQPEEILKDVLTLLRPQADRQGIRLLARSETPVPVRIQSDPVRLRQVLLNLVSNAVKFTHLGGVEVLVEASRKDQQNLLTFTVVDTGIGMTEQQCQQIFEPFVQGDVSLTREYGGTGLGLAISQRMVQLLNGTLSVTSIPGSGSAFSVQIPFDAAATTMTDQYHLDEKNRSPVSPDKQSPVHGYTGRVLLVEDNPVNQRLISAQLKKSGATVELACDGAAAVKHFTDGQAADSFDLVFMDMQMPGLNGYDATRTLRELGVELPIIALSAHATTQDRLKCLSAGCTDFLTKPVSRRLLTEVCLQHSIPNRQGGTNGSASGTGLPQHVARATGVTRPGENKQQIGKPV